MKRTPPNVSNFEPSPEFKMPPMMSLQGECTHPARRLVYGFTGSWEKCPDCGVVSNIKPYMRNKRDAREASDD